MNKLISQAHQILYGTFLQCVFQEFISFILGSQQTDTQILQH